MHHSYANKIWKQFLTHRLGTAAFFVVLLFCFAGIYAPLLASSKPLMVFYQGELYFPLFKYLFYSGFYTKRLDIFFNLLMFTLPLFLLFSKRKMIQTGIVIAQIILFIYFGYFHESDPAADRLLNQQKAEVLKSTPRTWDFELKYMTPYAKLNEILKYENRKQNHLRHLPYQKAYGNKPIPTLWQHDLDNQNRVTSDFIKQRNAWLEKESKELSWVIMPPIPYHWEDDAGGEPSLNHVIPWTELTRTNRKNLAAALIFGIRISLVVGILAVFLAMIIGIPIGAFAGYYGGTLDILVSRLLEIWESMPTFFMLLLIVAMTQSKSIFLVISVIGIFGWTSFSRYIRGEFFKQRHLPYVEACHAQGFSNSYIMFNHILPNAIPPILTLLPFAIMGAITTEAGLSFLGLGEEGSCSWGVLMDEGRSAFPGESYLLWPPALLLTTLLVAIALVGDSLRDAIDPRLVKN